MRLVRRVSSLIYLRLSMCSFVLGSMTAEVHVTRNVKYKRTRSPNKGRFNICRLQLIVIVQTTTSVVVQGDTPRCFKPPVDIDLKVSFNYHIIVNGRFEIM